MELVLRGLLHLENHVLCLRSQVRTLMKILSLNFNTKGVSTIMRDEDFFMSRVESHSYSYVRLITPLKMSSWCSRSRIWLLFLWEHMWWSGSIGVFWWSCYGFCEIHYYYVMYASPPLVFASWKLLYEVLISMTSNLCWSSYINKIVKYISPITFPILLQTQ